MSADNTIAVASFPTKQGREYRVAHVQAIENCYDDEGVPQEIVDAHRFLYFGGRDVFVTPDKEKALLEASRIYEEIMSGPCPVVEYGIAIYDFTRPLVLFDRKKLDSILDRDRRSQVTSTLQQTGWIIESAACLNQSVPSYYEALRIAPTLVGPKSRWARIRHAGTSVIRAEWRYTHGCVARVRSRR
jgi:hypothetical protein